MYLNENNMNEFNKYMNEVVGFNVPIVSARDSNINRLPLIIKNKYNFFIGSLFNREIAFIQAKNNVYTKINELRKHIDIIRKAIGIPIVYVSDSMKSYNRKRFIQKGVSFIVPGKQMFMPELLIDFQDFAMEPRKTPETMTPAIQYLLLYHLQKENLEGKNFKTIAKSMNITAITVTRAASYLAVKGVCRIVGTKDKYLQFDKNKYDLWKEVAPLMQTPIKKQIFTSTSLDVGNAKLSGINALSHYTNLSDDDKTYYAMDKKNFDLIVKQNNSILFDEVDGGVVIEIWKYKPNGLCHDKFVDPLSIYLIYRENTDERVQIALSQLIDEIKW